MFSRRLGIHGFEQYWPFSRQSLLCVYHNACDIL